MDDHMLEEIKQNIKLCLQVSEWDSEDIEEIKKTRHYKAAAVLISAYNKLCKLYYSEEHLEGNLLPNVLACYKLYKSNNF